MRDFSYERARLVPARRLIGGNLDTKDLPGAVCVLGCALTSYIRGLALGVVGNPV